MTSNELSVPENEEESAALLEIWDKQKGPNAFREMTTDNNVKVFNKEGEAERNI